MELPPVMWAECLNFLRFDDVLNAINTCKVLLLSRAEVQTLWVTAPEQLTRRILKYFTGVTCANIFLYYDQLRSRLNGPTVVWGTTVCPVFMRKNYQQRIWPALFSSLPELQQVRFWNPKNLMWIPEDADGEEMDPGSIERAAGMSRPYHYNRQSPHKERLCSFLQMHPQESLNDSQMLVMVHGVLGYAQAEALPPHLSFLNIDLVYRCGQNQVVHQSKSVCGPCFCDAICNALSPKELLDKALFGAEATGMGIHVCESPLVLCTSPSEMLVRAVGRGARITTSTLQEMMRRAVQLRRTILEKHPVVLQYDPEYMEVLQGLVNIHGARVTPLLRRRVMEDASFGVLQEEMEEEKSSGRDTDHSNKGVLPSYVSVHERVSIETETARALIALLGLDEHRFYERYTAVELTDEVLPEHEREEALQDEINQRILSTHLQQQRERRRIRRLIPMLRAGHVLDSDDESDLTDQETEESDEEEEEEAEEDEDHDDDDDDDDGDQEDHEVGQDEQNVTRRVQ